MRAVLAPNQTGLGAQGSVVRNNHSIVSRREDYLNFYHHTIQGVETGIRKSKTPATTERVRTTCVETCVLMGGPSVNVEIPALT